MLFRGLLGYLVCLRRAKVSALADGALLRGHEVERQVKTPAHEDEDQPIELLYRNNVAVAKVAVLRRAHRFSRLSYR